MEKTEEIERYLYFHKKIRVLKLVRENVITVKEACEIFSISITTFYNWKKSSIKMERKVF